MENEIPYYVGTTYDTSKCDQIKRPMDPTKLKKFDLQKALQGDPVMTHDMELITPKNWQQYEISIRMADGMPAIFYTPHPNTKGGTIWHHIDLLFMAPKVRTVWVNLYPKSETRQHFDSICTWHDTEEAANSLACSPRLGNRAYQIEITEE